MKRDVVITRFVGASLLVCGLAQVTLLHPMNPLQTPYHPLLWVNALLLVLMGFFFLEVKVTVD